MDHVQNLLMSSVDRVRLREEVEKLREGMNPHPAGQKQLNVPKVGGIELPGMQHKYRETLLFFPAEGQYCQSFCTYCFRWAQFTSVSTTIEVRVLTLLLRIKVVQFAIKMNLLIWRNTIQVATVEEYLGNFSCVRPQRYPRFAVGLYLALSILYVTQTPYLLSFNIPSPWKICQYVGFDGQRPNQIPTLL